MTLKALLLALLLPGAAQAACRDILFDARAYTVCDVAVTDALRVFHSGPDGAVYGSFDAINERLAQTGQTLGFAMNAGMYHQDRRPVGLMIEGGIPRSRIVTRAGPGNFSLLPNGVFCITPDRFAVVESRAYAATPPNCRDATQSGPMLVIDGRLHPRFLADSDSLNIRNGVGVNPDGRRAYFAISNDPVNFHSFARLFRDLLKVQNALYFDGSISRLYAPDLGRHDAGFRMGPIIGTVMRKD